MTHFENGKYIINRECPTCSKNIIYCSSKKFIAERSYRNALKENRVCKQCAKTGEKNSFYGKTHTKNSIDSISKSRIGKATGEGNCMANPINRKKVSVGLRLKWDSGEMEHVRENNRITMTETQASGKIKSTYKSKGEDKLYEVLLSSYPNLVRQKTVKSKHFDFYIPEKNLLIEYNGDYWHCNPTKYAPDYYNQKKSVFAKDLWEYDKNKIHIAESLNYFCMTIWESEFKINPDLIIEKVKNFNI